MNYIADVNAQLAMSKKITGFLGDAANLLI